MANYFDHLFYFILPVQMALTAAICMRVCIYHSGTSVIVPFAHARSICNRQVSFVTLDHQRLGEGYITGAVRRQGKR